MVTFKKFLLICSLVVLSLSLYGCSTIYNPATEKKEFVFIDTDSEIAIGKSVQEEVLIQKKPSKDAALEERVRRIGRRLAAVSDRKDLEYKFYVLEEKELNAMALPGGLIYVNSGLVKILDDDQLAYVIGHEVGHVAARHIAKKIQANLTYQLIFAIASAGMGSDRPVTRSVAVGVDTVYQLASLGYSRKDEYEADKIGARYSYRAGFDPYGALTALEKIKQEEGPNWKALGYFRSHPYADERIAALKKYIPEISAKNDP
jgi:predicted Zn-dependent protease